MFIILLLCHFPSGLQGHETKTIELTQSNEYHDPRAEVQIFPVPHSVLKDVVTVVHSDRSDEFGNVLSFDETVLSPVFGCATGDVLKHPIPMTSKIDRDIILEAKTCDEGDDDCEKYIVPFDDICFAKMNKKRGAWECVEDSRLANPVTVVSHKVVSSNLYQCEPRSEGGSVYAFVLHPAPDPDPIRTDTPPPETALWIWILVGVLVGTLLLACCSYAVIRLYRYRKKYHLAKTELDIAHEELDREEENRELGLGNFGDFGDGAHMQQNPLVYDDRPADDEDVQLELQQMNQEMRKQRADALFERQQLEQQMPGVFAHREEFAGEQQQRRDVG